MPEDDTIGRIIRRDLDRLPMLPADRWVPRPQPARGWLPAVGARLGRGALAVGAAAFLVVSALAVGSTVRALRASPVASDPQTARAQPLGICAGAQDRVLSLSGIVTRLDRLAVKRMTVSDLESGRDARGAPLSQPAAPLASTTALCVVAVSGEIRQTFGLLDTGPFKWAVFASVAGGDDSIVSTSMGSDGSWPPYFDALPDRQPNPYPGTVVEVMGQGAVRVRLESAVLSAEFGNPVLVEVNKYTLIQPASATLGLVPGDRVAISFEREGRNPSSGAYPLSIFRLTDATLPTTGQPIGYVPSAACTVITFTRSSDEASARWTFTCRGAMTLEAWREGLRRTAVDQGWRETSSQSDVLEFIRDDLRIAMTIDARPPDGAFALTQVALRRIPAATLRTAFEEAIRAAVGSPAGTGFASFPRTIASQPCEIRGGGPPRGMLIPATCRTEVQVSGSNYVVRFTYVWDARQFHLAGEPSTGDLQHTWSFIVDPAGTVVVGPESGNFPPQYAR